MIGSYRRRRSSPSSYMAGYVFLLEILEILATAEGPTGTGDDKNPDIRITLTRFERTDLRAERVIEGVEDIRSIRGECHHVISGRHLNGFISACLFPSVICSERGLRFSMNADMPSFWSSVSKSM